MSSWLSAWWYKIKKANKEALTKAFNDSTSGKVFKRQLDHTIAQVTAARNNLVNATPAARAQLQQALDLALDAQTTANKNLRRAYDDYLAAHSSDATISGYRPKAQKITGTAALMAFPLSILASVAGKSQQLSDYWKNKGDAFRWSNPNYKMTELTEELDRLAGER
jgi:hypothetical protein